MASRALADAHAAGTRSRDLGLVLLVDDEPLLLRALQRILARTATASRCAETPEAEDALADPDLDVVVLSTCCSGRRAGSSCWSA